MYLQYVDVLSSYVSTVQSENMIFTGFGDVSTRSGTEKSSPI